MHEYTIVKKSHMDAFHFVNYLLYLPQKQHHKHDEHKTFPHIYRLTAFYMACHHAAISMQRNQSVGTTNHDIRTETIVQSAENK